MESEDDMARRFDPDKLDTLTEKHFAEAMKLAGGIVSCAWLVATIRDRKRKEPKYVPVVIFWDMDHKKFSHMFTFEGGRMEVEAFVSRLKKATNAADDLNSGRGNYPTERVRKGE